MYCNNCGTQNPDDSTFCSKCGNKLAAAQSIPPQAQPVGMPARKTNGLSIASLVTGIVGFLIPISAIAAIVLGIVALNQIKKDPTLDGKGMAIAGIVCGGVVIVLWILLILFLVIAVATSSSTTSDFWVSALNLSYLI